MGSRGATRFTHTLVVQLRTFFHTGLSAVKQQRTISNCGIYWTTQAGASDKVFVVWGYGEASRKAGSRQQRCLRTKDSTAERIGVDAAPGELQTDDDGVHNHPYTSMRDKTPLPPYLMKKRTQLEVIQICGLACALDQRGIRS